MKWIKVGDRLPLFCKEVMIFVDGEHHIGFWYDVDWFTKRYDTTKDSLCDYDKVTSNIVTHWMEIEEPV